jgi:hypothetical protein
MSLEVFKPEPVRTAPRTNQDAYSPNRLQSKQPEELPIIFIPIFYYNPRLSCSITQF